MYNKLIDKFHQDGLDFPKDSVKTEGAYFVQVLCFKVGFRETGSARSDSIQHIIA